MSKHHSASERAHLIKQAQKLPKGSEGRRAILAGLKNATYTDYGPEFWKLPPGSQAFIDDVFHEVYRAADKVRKQHGFQDFLNPEYIGDTTQEMVESFISAMNIMAKRRRKPLP